MRARPAQAYERMKALDLSFAPVLDGKIFAGIIKLKSAEDAMKRGLRDISSVVIEAATISSEANLEDVLPHMIQTDSDEPVVVTTEDDELIGVVSRTKVAELVASATAEDALGLSSCNGDGETKPASETETKVDAQKLKKLLIKKLKTI